MSRHIQSDIINARRSDEIPSLNGNLITTRTTIGTNKYSWMTLAQNLQIVTYSPTLLTVQVVRRTDDLIKGAENIVLLNSKLIPDEGVPKKQESGECKIVSLRILMKFKFLNGYV